MILVVSSYECLIVIVQWFSSIYAYHDILAAIVRSDGTILGECLASQHSIHEQWGGVVPNLAKSAHEDNIDRVIQSALDKSGMTIEDVDAIGVTVGPGLEICLRVGCERAKELAAMYGKPFVGVHHVSLQSDYDVKKIIVSN
jgi:N6-L-threonylcarbamoyladenine synthase